MAKIEFDKPKKNVENKPYDIFLISMAVITGVAFIYFFVSTLINR